LSGTQAFVLVAWLDVEGWTSGSLAVRVHAIDMHANHQISVIVRTTAPTVEDPTVDFVSTSALAQAVVDTSVGALVTDSIDLRLAGFVEVSIEGRKGATGTASVAATLSAQLYAKAKQ
jgi:hypothetical protein